MTSERSHIILRETCQVQAIGFELPAFFSYKLWLLKSLDVVTSTHSARFEDVHYDRRFGTHTPGFLRATLIHCALVFFSSRRTDSRTGQTLESVQSASRLFFD